MAREQRTGIIDTLSSAYGLVNRWPALMLVPVLLDLFFWFGPRLSVDGLLVGLADWLAAQPETNQDVVEVLRAGASQTDLFALLALQTPSIVRVLNPAPALFGATRPVMVVTDPGMAVLLGLLLTLVGLVLVALYLVPIARVVRDGRPGVRAAAVPVARAWARQFALYGMLIAGGLAVVVPLALLTALLGWPAL